jgi:hypothetical protein
MKNMIDIKKNKETCLKLLRETGREGIEDLIVDLEKMGYFTAPASAVYHLNCEGGLVQHSLNTYNAAVGVWENMKNYCPHLAKEVSKDNIIMAALLHDICKCDVYKRKNESSGRFWKFGKEETAPYSASYDEFPIGHGEKSVILALCSGVSLCDSEMVAIRWHMGPWSVNMDSNEDKQSYRAAQDRYALTTIIQVADTLAAKVMER